MAIGCAKLKRESGAVFDGDVAEPIYLHGERLHVGAMHAKPLPLGWKEAHLAPLGQEDARFPRRVCPLNA